MKISLSWSPSSVASVIRRTLRKVGDTQRLPVMMIMLNVIARLVESTYNSAVISGFCYTQITDVEQEINGLLTYDRQPKVPLEVIKQINDQMPTQ